MTRWPLRMEAAALRTLAREARLRAAVLRDYEVTGARHDRVRRGEVIAAVARALGLAHAPGGAAFANEVRTTVVALGGRAVLIDGYGIYSGLRRRSGESGQSVKSGRCDIAPPPPPKPGTPAFEKLRREWYEKADPLGEDLEDARNPDAPLSNRGTITVRTQDGKAHVPTAESRREREAFMRAAQAFFESHRFRDIRDKEIWRRVANGVAARDIALELRMRKASVLRIVRRLKETMSRRNEG